MPTHNFTQFLFAQTHKTYRHNLHKLNSCRPAACHAVMQTQLQTPRNTTVICADTHTQPNTIQTVTPSCKLNAATKIQQGLATRNGKIVYLHFLYDELYFDCNTCFFTTEY